MKVVMTLLVRDEQDIIATNIDYHLAQGIDMIIVTDNLSRDNTPSILQAYEKKGLIKVIQETSDDYSQHKWVTRMARMAYTDYDADWVINNDADEFWFPNNSQENIKQILEEVSSEVFACKSPRINFLPPSSADEKNYFATTMTIREQQSNDTNGQPLAPKTCHRASPNIIVKQGNHHVEIHGERLQPLEIPITIFHFPLRSFSQFENKISKGGAAYERNKELKECIGITWRILYTRYQDNTLNDYYLQQILPQKSIREGLASKKLINDRRLINYIHDNLDFSTLSNTQHLTKMGNRFVKKITNTFSFIKKSKKGEGIITLADENYFQGLLILYHSVQKNYKTPIVCYDIGLTNDQINWIKENLPLLTIKEIPDTKIIQTIKNHKEETKLGTKGKRQWPLWICPFLIQHSPFTKTLWLDCDLVVLRNLDKLFKKLDKGPIFTPENHAPHLTGNKPELYELLPIKREFNEDNALINAGVSGWHLTRDKEILNNYSQAVSKAFENAKIKNAISWHDQGSLIWAILNSDAENRVEKAWKWNLCVKHTLAKELKFTWNEKVFNELRNKVPEANILHWNGKTVPWK